MPITIVGLGPGDPALLTRAAWDTLAQAPELYLRTARHPTVAGLPGVSHHSFDALYERQPDQNFDAVYDAIAGEVVRLGARPEGVVYAVPGHPLVGEATVKRILALAQAEGQAVRIVAGLSFVEPTLETLGVDALEGLQLADAAEIAHGHHPPLNTDRPALLGQLYSRALASDVKLTLLNAYPPEHPVTIVQGAGTASLLVAQLPLHELDHAHAAWDAAPHLTSLYVPPLALPGSFETLAETVARLRAPGGCPWDMEQTHESLRPELLEEAYEVLAALDAEDADSLREELGDLLLNILMQTQIAVEGGEFSISDVIASVDAKLKRRHPHVFGDVVVKNVDELLANWEKIKHAERAEKSAADAPAPSALDGIGQALPALSQAQGYQKRAARVGFDWPDVQGVLAKIAEEIAELRRTRTAARRQAELGDLLFAVVNLARWWKVDAETALRAANGRFARRFRSVEAGARAQGRSLKELSLEEMDVLWEKAKRQERRRKPGAKAAKG